MKLNNDQVSSGVFFLIGLAICLGSLQYKVGSFSSPQSGLMPFMVGAFILFLSSLGFIHGTIRHRKGEIWARVRDAIFWKRNIIIILALLIYVGLLNLFGYFLCTVFFIGFMLKVVVPHRWLTVIVVSFLTATISYLIFVVFLKAQLPEGLLGI